LSVVERTAKLLGCRLALRSAAGCGTRFSIVLDQRIAALAEQVSPAERRAEVFADLTGVRVLLLEDDNAARVAAQALLESWGCVVFTAASVQQACAVVQAEGVPDIVVSDYHLGGGDSGLNAIAAVREVAQYRVHACLMSGDTDVAVRRTARSAGLTLSRNPCVQPSCAACCAFAHHRAPAVRVCRIRTSGSRVVPIRPEAITAWVRFWTSK